MPHHDTIWYIICHFCFNDLVSSKTCLTSCFNDLAFAFCTFAAFLLPGSDKFGNLLEGTCRIGMHAVSGLRFVRTSIQNNINLRCKIYIYMIQVMFNYSIFKDWAQYSIENLNLSKFEAVYLSGAGTSNGSFSKGQQVRSQGPCNLSSHKSLSVHVGIM